MNERGQTHEAAIQERAGAAHLAHRPPQFGCMEIPIVNRLRETVAFALVDEADYELLADFWWHLHVGYAARGRNEFMHHVLLGKPDGKRTIDHINRDRLDNRRSNLRVCTIGENSQNVPARPKTSAFRGVSFQKGKGRWRAQVRINGVSIHCGSFASEADAAAAAVAGRARLMPFSREDAQ